MAETSQTLSFEFYTSFQASRSALTARIDTAKSDPTNLASAGALDALNIDVAKLRTTLIDARVFLPTYDQRQCELQLKALEDSLEELRVSSAPKSKFAFKRRQPAVKSASIPPAQVSVPNSASTPVFQSPSTTLLSTNLLLSSRSASYLDVSSISDPNTLPSHTSDLTISDLDGCIVNLLGDCLENGPRLAAIHVQNLRDTILILPPIAGSIILHDLTRCLVVVGCHQFRMHTSASVDVYLHIPSHPIIEHSSRIRFAAYPPSLNSYLTAAGLTAQISKHADAQDFSHIKASPSPNWSLIPEATRTPQDWPLMAPTDDLDDLLMKLLPPP